MHIAKVLNYARKNKHPRSRSALIYWEEDYPSRLDLGKDKYGGPFSEEEVEDVKTVLRLLPLLVCMPASGVLSSFTSSSEKGGPISEEEVEDGDILGTYL